jgi:hypothetical protein
MFIMIISLMSIAIILNYNDRLDMDQQSQEFWDIILHKGRGSRKYILINFS